MVINRKFKYPDLLRKSVNGVRYYDVDNTNVPSVTSILDKTTDKTFLEKWKQRIGEQKALEEMQYAANVGTLMHEHLENHILKRERSKNSNHIHKLAYTMADKIIEYGLSEIDEIYGIEENLYYEDLWAGSADLVASYKGKISICDYKNSKTIKKEEHIENYKCQLAAYALAHNKMFGTNITQGVIFMCARDLDYKTFVIDGKDFEEHAYMWAKKVELYHTLYN